VRFLPVVFAPWDTGTRRNTIGFAEGITGVDRFPLITRIKRNVFPGFFVKALAYGLDIVFSLDFHAIGLYCIPNFVPEADSIGLLVYVVCHTRNRCCDQKEYYKKTFTCTADSLAKTHEVETAGAGKPAQDQEYL
jgi:hypothetical protein